MVVAITSSRCEEAPILSVVVPTLDERANVEVLFARLCSTLHGVAWEMIVVDDDSRDGTWLWAKATARTDRRLRCLRRVNRRGLAGACIEGALSSSALYIAIIDADLQHDEAILVDMLQLALEGKADLVIGTRRQGMSPRESMNLPRRSLSAIGAILSRRLLSRDVVDPMSGYFLIRREVIENLAPILVTDGFKILVDVLMNAPQDLRVAEIEYVFRERTSGESKLNMIVAIDYLGLLIHQLSYKVVSPRFVLYALSGASGLIVHLMLLRCLLLASGDKKFGAMEFVASYSAMISNFFVNNAITFRDRRFRGWSMIPAMFVFCAICSVGVIADLSITTWLFDPSSWWLAGISGALISTFWNFGVSGNVVWSARARNRAAPWDVSDVSTFKSPASADQIKLG